MKINGMYYKNFYEYEFDNEECEEDNIRCPYCKNIQQDVETSIIYGENEDTEYECDTCGKIFLINSYPIFRITTTPIKEEFEKMLEDKDNDKN